MLNVTFKPIHFALFLALLVTLSASAAQAQEANDAPKPLRYSFQTVNFPGDTFTQLLGVNSTGKIAGYHGQAINQGFVLTLPDSFTSENFPNSTQTQVVGINNSGNTAGFYIDQAGVTHGFLDIRGTPQTIDYPKSATAKTPFNQLLGLNVYNDAVGYFADAANEATSEHAYVYEDGQFLPIYRELVPLGAAGSQATSISNKGTVSGFYFTNQGTESHGFLERQGTITKLDYPGSKFTQALGVNVQEEVVGFYIDSAGNTHGFVYRQGQFQKVDEPQAVEPGGTVINGVNDQGEIVGFYVDAAGNTDGFVGTPQ